MNTENFIEEFTTNYSELFVESFILKYTYEFSCLNIFEDINKAHKMLNKKIQNKIQHKFKSNEK